MKNGKQKYFSVCTGVGGFEIGIRDKAECIGFSEIERSCNQLLKNKFPYVNNYGDITKIIPKELPEFDGLCGGFPCQPFSIAGKRGGYSDTRGTIFFYIAGILKIKRPSIVILENVKGILNHKKGETFRVILQTLEELGYNIQWMVLNSKFFGVPQNRERVFIIGNLRGTSRSEILPFRKSDKIFDERFSETETASSLQHPGHSGGNYRGMNMISKTIRKGGQRSLDEKHNWDIIRIDKQEGRDKEINRVYSSEGIAPALHLKTGGWQEPKITIPVLTPDRQEKRQNGRRFKEDGDESFTLTGQDIHGVAVMNTIQEAVGTRAGSSASFKKSVENIYSSTLEIRRLTPMECERLQGFPDNWTEGFSDTQRYRMMGNAVTVNVIKELANKIWKQKK